MAAALQGYLVAQVIMPTTLIFLCWAWPHLLDQGDIQADQVVQVAVRIAALRAHLVQAAIDDSLSTLKRVLS